MPLIRGRAAGKSAKTWRAALERELNKRMGPGDDAPRKLEKVAAAVVDAALAGDMLAAKEIGNRIDGMPIQQHEVRSGPLDDRSDSDLTADLAFLNELRAAVIAASGSFDSDALAGAETKGSA